MAGLIRFGTGTKVYTFPAVKQDYLDNFSDVNTRVTPIPGVSGGFDIYGAKNAPSRVGLVQATFFLQSFQGEEMTSLRDAIRQMRSWGRTLLWMQPTDSTLSERFCLARVKSIDIPRQEHLYSDIHQEVKVVWEVPDPHWYTTDSEADIWGGGAEWGETGVYWGGPGDLIEAVSGLETDFTLTVDGIEQALPRIAVTGAFTSLTIQRLAYSRVVDELVYSGSLVSGDSLEINCRGLSIRLNGVDDYDNLSSFINPSWLRLEPGENLIRVKLGSVSETGNIMIRWYGTYI